MKYLLTTAAAIALLAFSTPTYAVDTAVVSQAAHFAECLGWLISDPAKHAQFCSPGHTVFVSSSTGFAKPPCKHEDLGL